MRFYGIALLAGAAVLGACGGEKQSATDSSAANANASSAQTATPGAATTDAGAAGASTATGATGTAAAGGSVAAAPATGATHEVKMIGDAKGYRFEPAQLTIKQGDAVKWVMVAGGPHNVAFQNVSNAAAQAQIDANMPGQKMGPAASQMLMQPNEALTVSFAKVPAGTYDYICQPHAAMNMKGSITVQ